MLLPLLFEWLAVSLPIIIFVAWCIIALALAVWVYRDAESRGKSGELWLLIVLLTGIIGLIVYLIVR